MLIRDAAQCNDCKTEKGSGPVSQQPVHLWGRTVGRSQQQKPQGVENAASLLQGGEPGGGNDVDLFPSA